MRVMRKILVLAFLWIPLSHVRAAQVVPMSVGEMADHSGQVIVGTVSNVRTYWAENPRRIESEVSFETVAFLKGNPSGSDSAFKLTVPGGKIDDMQMRVCCAPEFRAGDKWILMLLPTYKTFPVVGVYRGALRVKVDDAGVERVYNIAGRSVTGIDAEGHLLLDGQAQRDIAQHLVASRGARLNMNALRQAPNQEAMRLSAFVAELNPVLAASRQHTLSESSGRRVVADLRPVTLKQSPMGRTPSPSASSAGRELPKPKEANADPRRKEARP